MYILDKNVIYKILAIWVIVALILSDFLFVGKSLVSYAIDVVNTNNENVEFMAYFLNNDGEKVDIVEKEVDKETKLFVEISVKQEGYFNGEIVLKDSNFNFKNGQKNEYISEISNDTVVLKQINADTNVVLELEVEPIYSNSINQKMLNTITKVSLEGNYINSQNVGKNLDTGIYGENNVQLVWKSRSETAIELDSEVLTNYNYFVNGEEKRILQVLVNSNITANNYPVKNSYFALSVPQNVENVKVHARSTDATNGNEVFDEGNYVYDEQNGIIKIQLDNQDLENISWNKNAKDTFVVTYIFDKQENLENKVIKVASLISTYDEKNLYDQKEITVDKEIDGIISGFVVNFENSIYKGKIYSKEEREYIEKTVINIDHLDILNNLEIMENESKLIAGEKEQNSNIVYKSTKIDKNEFLKIFGEDGYITIKDEAGTVVSNINNNSETNEDGSIIVNYNNPTKALNIITSKPIAVGELKLENTKVVLDSGLTRANIDDLTQIKGSLVVNKKEQNNYIELKNTETKASLKVSPTSILSTEESEQMEIEATLLANDESKDLYKNPKVTFILPSELEIETPKYAVLYKNGLEVSGNTAGRNENGEYVIEINLEGEQLKYEYDGGTKIYVKAQVKAKKEVENKTSKIQMIYTNENKNEINQLEAGIELETANTVTNNREEISQIEDLNQELSLRRSAMNANISRNSEAQDRVNIEVAAVSGVKALEENEDIYEGQTINYIVKVTNNTGRDFENVEIKANQKNGYVWDICEENLINHYYSEDIVVEHFYEPTDSNEKIIAKLDSLKNGESYTYSYEATSYLLNNENIDGAQIYGTVSVKSDDNELDESVQTVKNNINNAELKVEVLERSSREIKWNSNSAIKAEINVKNLTNEVKTNVKLRVLLIKNLNIGDKDLVENLFLFNGLSDRVSIEGVGTNSEGQSVVTLNISLISANEDITIGVSPYTNEIEQDEEKVEMCVQALTTPEKVYQSNNLVRSIYNSSHKLELTQIVTDSNGREIDYENEKIQDGEIINITGTITNKEEKTFYPYIKYKLNDALEVQSATLRVGNNQTDITSDINSNELIKYGFEIEGNSSAIINIVAKLNTNNLLEEEIKNVLEVVDLKTNKNNISTIKLLIDEGENETVEKPKDGVIEVTDEPENEGGIVIIKPKDDVADDEDNENENENENGNENSNENENKEDNKEDNKENNDNTTDSKDDKTTYTISGTAWIDSNKDGKKESSEEKFNDMTIGAIDAFSGEVVATTKTNTNGAYELKVPKGDYIVVFYYNDELYTITTYQAEGTSNNENSNAVAKTFIINNESVKVGATDTLKVVSNLKDINIGLINRGKFQLKLDKYVSKIVVSNSAGTKTYEQKSNTQLAKVEIKAKNLKNSLVVIEYKIKITNTGDLEGYARNIVDYLPSGLNFNSTMNTNWYKSGDYVYNTSLANTKIKPGETKEITLIATKNMTESNTGLVNNKAEIESSSNVLGLENELKEKGSADVIISVGTGALVSYVSYTSIIFIVSLLIAYLINKIKKENNI